MIIVKNNIGARLHLHCVKKGWQHFLINVNFDEESIDDVLQAQKILLFLTVYQRQFFRQYLTN